MRAEESPDALAQLPLETLELRAFFLAAICADKRKQGRLDDPAYLYADEALTMLAPILDAKREARDA